MKSLLLFNCIMFSLFAAPSTSGDVCTSWYPEDVLHCALVEFQGAVTDEKVTYHHKESGVKITLPADSRHQLGTYNDGMLGTQNQYVFRQEVPADWNALKVDLRSGNTFTTIYIYVLPAAESDDFSNVQANKESYLKKLLGIDLDVEVTIGSSTQYAGQPAEQIEIRYEYAEMGTLIRNTTILNQDNRFGYAIYVPYILDQNDGSDTMAEMVEWFTSNVVIELPD